MGNAVSWIDRGADGFRVYIDIPLRRNGLPNLAAVQAASTLLENFRPSAYDPVEGVSESVAQAAQRDMGYRYEGACGNKYRTRLEAVQNGEQFIRPLYAVDTEADEQIEITADEPPLPDFGIPILDAGLLPDDDEIVFPRACPAGGCDGE